jgi:hypothetical protein
MHVGSKYEAFTTLKSSLIRHFAYSPTCVTITISGGLIDEENKTSQEVSEGCFEGEKLRGASDELGKATNYEGI